MVAPKALHNSGSTSCQHTLATLDRYVRFLLIKVMRMRIKEMPLLTLMIQFIQRTRTESQMIKLKTTRSKKASFCRCLGKKEKVKKRIRKKTQKKMKNQLKRKTQTGDGSITWNLTAIK